MKAKQWHISPYGFRYIADLTSAHVSYVLLRWSDVRNVLNAADDEIGNGRVLMLDLQFLCIVVYLIELVALSIDGIEAEDLQEINYLFRVEQRRRTQEEHRRFVLQELTYKQDHLCPYVIALFIIGVLNLIEDDQPIEEGE